MASRVLLLGLLAITCFITLASAQSLTPLQDFCVADLNSPVTVNGFICKDPKLVDANDFFFSGLNITGNTSNPFGSAITPVTVLQFPGLNTLGVAMGRFDYAPGGVIRPHTHPRATEIYTVIEGTTEVGFITNNSTNNHLFKKVLQKGDVFVFPQGLVHFHRNVGQGPAVSLFSFNSQNPGLIIIPPNLFGSEPLIPTEVLTKSFQVSKSVVAEIESQFKGMA
ncbi:hypothetical protein Vadar_032223 [Vaccinium darrowii]|uniref:Uncharacterized protein n=1 Tax=Vaccinium darrowii TaxID=229202 RepID=A0ACB7XDP7_9ERIC|nr:hypothetical protein Vadar_032223 [Vaccinium darrowii]